MSEGTIGAMQIEERRAYRPRVPRETRRLLVTMVVAVLTLWVLARFRFPDRPVTPNPVAPLLSQLDGGSKFADLASIVGDLRVRLGPSLVALVPADLARRTARPDDRVAALRTHDDLAIAILAPEMRAAERDPLGVIAEDQVSGLAVLRVGADGTRPAPQAWVPHDLDRPQYVIATSPSRAAVSLRPVFVGSLTPVEAPGWNEMVWALPRDASLEPGTFLFTEDAALIGVTVRLGGGIAVLPATVLLAAADGLIAQPAATPGELGVEVQPLTASLSIASGAEAGVMVTWVDPQGAAAGALQAGDVIGAVDGAPMPTPEHWDARVERLRAGTSIALNVIRKGAPSEVMLTAAAPGAPKAPARLGLLLRQVPAVGVEVLRVDRDSAASSSGIEAGDVITAIGGVAAPSPAHVRSAFANADRGQLLLVALMRGASHRMVTIER